MLPYYAELEFRIWAGWVERRAEGRPSRQFRIWGLSSVIVDTMAGAARERAIPAEQILLLALIQGVTEFAPVSSSAHLALLPALFGGPDQGLLLDVAAHAGTLLAVVVFFRRESLRILRGSLLLAAGRWRHEDAALALLLAIATLPAVAVGLLLWAAGLAEALRGIEAIGVFTLLFALVLWLADRFGGQARDMRGLNRGQALWIGMAQALAFLPGASRAGVTMSAARALGFGREAAGRISFLFAIPVIAAATALGGVEIVRSGEPWLQGSAVLVLVLSFLFALGALWALTRYLRRWSLLPFVWYRICLGLALLAYAWA